MDVKFYCKDDLASKGISIARFLELITAIDEECGLIEEPYEVVVKKLIPVFDATEDMWRAILINGEVKGYWNCVALDEKHQMLLEQGRFLESYVNVNNLKKDLFKEKNALLFDSVCLSPSCQNLKLSGHIYKSIYETLNALPLKGIQVNEIWASIWSPEGIKFFSEGRHSWGFVPVVENIGNEGIEGHGYIYRVDFDEAMKKLESNIKKLKL